MGRFANEITVPTQKITLPHSGKELNVTSINFGVLRPILQITDDASDEKTIINVDKSTFIQEELCWKKNRFCMFRLVILLRDNIRLLF